MDSFAVNLERNRKERVKKRTSNSKQRIVAIFKLRKDGMTFPEIGELFGFSQANARSLYEKAVRLNIAGRLLDNKSLLERINIKIGP